MSLTQVKCLSQAPVESLRLTVQCLGQQLDDIKFPSYNEPEKNIHSQNLAVETKICSLKNRE